MRTVWINIFLLISLIILMCIPAYAEEGFIEIYRTENEIRSLNIASVEDRGEYVVAWTKMIPRGELLSKLNKKGVKVSFILSLNAYNKKYKQYMFIKDVYYDKQQAVIATKDFDSHEWKELPPNTVGEAEYDSIMLVYKIQQKQE